MLRTLGISTALLLCGWALAVPAAAQNMAGVSGIVTDLEGKPFADVTVIFKSVETGLAYTSKTDKSGHYSQVGMRPGVYEVTLKQKDTVIFNTKGQPIAASPDNVFDINLKEFIRKESAEESAARKKQEEEHQKFTGMKAHFDAGRAKADEAAQLRAEIAKAPADQRPAMQEKLQGLYQSALTEFQQSQQAASEKDPNMHIVWYNLGDTYDRMGKYQEAADAYQKAIELKPDLAGYYNNLGNVLAKLGRIPDAMKAYEKSASIDPSNASSVWLNCGIVLYNANRLSDAVEPLKKATTLNPNGADAWYLLGASLLSTMQTKQEGDKVTYIVTPGTVEAYQKYLQLSPSGKYAGDAKAALDAIASLGGGVETKVKVKKKP